MAGFAPTFEGNMGIEQSVAAPTSGLGSVVDIVSIFAKNAPTKTPDRAPSEDERNAALWKGSMGGKDIDTASVEDLQKFARKYPSAGSWVYGAAEDMRNQALGSFDQKLTVDQRIDAAWMESPQGQRALMQSNQLEDPAAQATLLARERAKYVENSARSAELTQETQQYGVNDSRRAEMWTLETYDLTAGADIVSNAFTDAIESMQLNPGSSINLDDIGEGVNKLTVKLPQLAGTVMTSANAPQVLKTFRAAYKDAQTKRIAGSRGITPGEVGTMPSDVEAAVFGRMDTLITWTEKELDPATIRSRLENTAFNKLVEAGVPLEVIASISMATKGNPELQAAVMGTLTGDLGNLLELYQGGSFEEARVAARALSEKERTRSFAGFSELAKVWGGTSSVGSVYEEVNQTERALNFGSATIGALEAVAVSSELDANGKPARLGPNFYKNNIEANAANFDAAAAANPQFAPTVVKHLSSDLNMQMQETNQKANAEGYRISTDTSGKVFFAPTDETLARIAELEGEISLVEGQEAAPVGALGGSFATKETTIERLNQEIEDLKTPPTIPLTDIQYKWSVLGNLGKVGSEVRVQVGASFNLEVDAGVAREARAALSATTGTAPQAQEVISNFEGFRKTAYWDVNAWRTGYGSDTVTLADGTIQKVTKDTVVNQEDAKRDLERRTAEFADTAKGNVGADAWDSLGSNVKSALTSIAYNYGSLPDRIRPAVKSGDIEAIAKAIEGLAGDNDGVNSNRRMAEAAIVRGNYAPGVPQVNTTALEPATAAPATSVRPEARPVSVGSSASAPTASIRPEARPMEQTATATEERPLFKGAAIPTVAATPTTDKNVMAFLESLGSSPDSTYTMSSVADVEAAQASGSLRTGDRVLITGEGKPYLVEVE